MTSDKEVKSICIEECKIGKWLNLTYSSSKITHISQSKDVLICKVDAKLSHKLVQKFMSILA